MSDGFLHDKQIPQIDFPADKIAPVTIITHPPPNQLNKGWLRALVNDWSFTDDVFRPEFLQNTIFVSSDAQHADIGDVWDELQNSWRTAWSTTIRPETDVEGFNSGPFVI